MSEELYLLDDCFLLVRDFLAVNVDVPPPPLPEPWLHRWVAQPLKMFTISGGRLQPVKVIAWYVPSGIEHIYMYIYIYYVYIYAYIHYKVCMYTVIPH